MPFFRYARGQTDVETYVQTDTVIAMCFAVRTLPGIEVKSAKKMATRRYRKFTSVIYRSLILITAFLRHRRPCSVRVGSTYLLVNLSRAISSSHFAPLPRACRSVLRSFHSVRTSQTAALVDRMSLETTSPPRKEK